MQVITIAMQKGGVGKSTIARSLAVAAARDGLSVLMIDMDSQQSVSQWAERREGDMPVVVFSTENELPKKLAQAKGVADLVIIDTPPARSTEAPAAVDVEPLEQMPRTLRLCRGFSRPVFAVVNMANPTGPAEVVYTREVIEAMGAKIAPVVLHRRKAHRDASASGQTVQEVDPKGKAATEVDNLWAWVRAELQGSK
jgi:chromosome partitioning protein